MNADTLTNTKKRIIHAIKAEDPLAIDKAKANIDVKEFTIDELAREAGSTVRNVRSYQDRA